jgi:hypothetical protein
MADWRTKPSEHNAYAQRVSSQSFIKLTTLTLCLVITMTLTCGDSVLVS